LLHDALARWSAWWGVGATHLGILVFPQSWNPIRAAYEVNEFVVSGGVVTPELFEW
jgi:hypothetical protein